MSVSRQRLWFGGASPNGPCGRRGGGWRRRSGHGSMSAHTAVRLTGTCPGAGTVQAACIPARTRAAEFRGDLCEEPWRPGPSRSGFRCGPVRDGTPCSLPVPSVGLPQDEAVGAILMDVIATYAAGTTAIAGEAGAINEIVTFLPASAPLTFAAAAASDLPWLTPDANLLDKLRRGGIQRQWCRNRRQGR